MYDQGSAALVGLYAGAPNTDRDFERAYAGLEALYAGDGPRIAAALLIVDPGLSAPNASWRARYADLHAIDRHYRLVVMTESAVARGILTAVQWIQPLRPGQKTVAFGRFDPAVSWLETECGRSLACMHQMFAQLRLPRPAPQAAIHL